MSEQKTRALTKEERLATADQALREVLESRLIDFPSLAKQINQRALLRLRGWEDIPERFGRGFAKLDSQAG